MLKVDTASDLIRYVGQNLGTSEWLTISQSMIDAFAEATGDTNWIHVDVDRARREMPEGKTIAHGYLTLSLIPLMSKTIYHIQRRGKGFNYGANRVRFTAPVQANSRIRLTETLKEASPTSAGVRLTFECVVEIEGNARPAMIAETIVLID